MLQELDVLIKTGKHENIINLIGTSETRDLVVVVMEHSSLNLKDLLLKSRDNLPGKFSTMTEIQAIDIALGICKGMAHLHSLNVKRPDIWQVINFENLLPFSDNPQTPLRCKYSNDQRQFTKNMQLWNSSVFQP